MNVHSLTHTHTHSLTHSHTHTHTHTLTHTLTHSLTHTSPLPPPPARFLFLRIEIGSSYIFDLYQSGNTLTMRNDHFESSGLWPTGGLDLTRRSSDFDINGIYDGNDTSITYIQNEFYMRLGGFSDEVQSEDDYSGASAGVVEDTSTAGRYTVIPVVDSDGGGDDDDSGAGPSFSVDFSRSGGQLVADVSVSQFDLIFTDRPSAFQLFSVVL